MQKMNYRSQHLAAAVSSFALFAAAQASAATVVVTDSTNLNQTTVLVNDAEDQTVVVGSGSGNDTLLVIAPLCGDIDPSVGCYEQANDAATVGFNSELIVEADSDQNGTGDASMVVGDNQSLGTVLMYQGGLTVRGQNANMTVGRDDGNGNLFVGVAIGDGGGTMASDIGTASSVSVEGQENATLVVGGKSEGGTAAAGRGHLSVGPGEVTVEGRLATVKVGTQDAGSGLIELLGFNSSLRVQGGDNNGDPAAVMVIGEEPGADGAVYIDGGNLQLFDTQNQSQLFIGAPRGFSEEISTDELDANGGLPMAGGYGNLTVVGGGYTFANSIFVGASAEGAGLPIGSTGEMVVSGSGTNRYFNASGVEIVEDFDSTVITDELYIGAVEDAGGGLSTGTVTVSNGGKISQAGSPGSVVIGSGGTLNIRGDGSEVTFNEVVVGNAASSHVRGDAFIDLDDGGRLDLNGGNLTIGYGGTVWGNGGVIDGNVILAGGTLAPGNSPGTLDILGDFSFLSGVIQLEIEGTGAGQFDVLNIMGSLSGDLIVDFIFDETLDFAGSLLNMINVGPQSDGNPMSRIIYSNNGIAQGTLDFGGEGPLSFNGSSLAYSDDDTTGNPPAVPLPAGLPLLLAGLGAFAVLSRRRALG